MLRGSISIYDFVIDSLKDINEIEKDLKEIFYKENSSVEQLQVSIKKGKKVVSFIKNKTNFESIIDDDEVIKTIKYNNHSFNEFMEEIFEKLGKYTNTVPTHDEFKKLSKKDKKDIQLGKPRIFDKEIDLIFNRKQKLFDIYENETIIDLTKNQNFMEYFFDQNYDIYPKKKTLLRRMLMGMTSYYPIDRSSIVNMPEIVEAPVLPIYENYVIARNINIVPCYMSSVQWTRYFEEYVSEKDRDSRRRFYDDDGNWHYRIRTRQNCNIVYDDVSFRKKR